jgi:diacylglycerol kinase family enzyme
MSLPLVIVNPASAEGATRENWPKIASDLRTHFGSFTVAFTEAKGHASELARGSCAAGDETAHCLRRRRHHFRSRERHH